MSFDRKARPKTGYWKQHSIAKQNSFTLPLPEREVHHYDMRLVVLPCPIEHAKVPVKIVEGIIRSCSLQTRCRLSRWQSAGFEPRRVTLNDWVLCLKGKRFAGAKT